MNVGQFVILDTMLLRPVLLEVFVVELGGDRRPVWTGQEFARSGSCVEANANTFEQYWTFFERQEFCV